MKRIIALLIVCAFPSLQADEEYISLLGNQALAKSDVVFRGLILNTYRMGGVASVARIDVREVLWGKAPDSPVSVVAADNDPFSESGIEVLVFASNMESTYLIKSRGQFFLGDDLGQIKLDVVRQVLELETKPGKRSDKIRRLQQMALSNLVDVDPWLAWNGAQEVHRLAVDLEVDFSASQLEQISDTAIHAHDDQLSAYLQTILTTLRNRSTMAAFAQTTDNESFSPQETTPLDSEEATNPNRLLEDLMSAPTPTAARRALREITALRLPMASRVLLNCLSHRWHEVRATAALLLADYPKPDVVRGLEKTLRSDSSLRVQKNAAKSLGRIGQERSIGVLRELSSTPGLAYDCLSALAAIDSHEAGQILQAELADLPPTESRRRLLLTQLLANRSRNHGQR